MRICYISYVKYGAGNWVHTSQFITALRKIHDDVVVHTPLISSSKGAKKDESKQHDGVKNNLRELRLFLAMFTKRAFSEFRYLKTVKPDVVILRQGRYLSAILLCRLMGLPILIENNAPFLENQFSRKEEQLRGRAFWQWLEKKMMGLSDHIMVVSEELKRHYVSAGFSSEQISVVPNGVNVEAFHPKIDGKKVRNELGLQGKIILGFSGSFAPWHGLDFLADAVEELAVRDEYKEIVLLLIGKPGIGVSMPKVPDNITIVTGRIPHQEVPYYLAAVDIFVAPYPLITPFYFSPLKIFEAMAMGKPVIASAQGQISELIRDRVSGVLYPPGNKELFLKKIDMLVRDAPMRDMLGQNARKAIESKFTWLDNAQKVFTLCEKSVDCG